MPEQEISPHLRREQKIQEIEQKQARIKLLSDELKALNRSITPSIMDKLDPMARAQLGMEVTKREDERTGLLEAVQRLEKERNEITESLRPHN